MGLSRGDMDIQVGVLASLTCLVCILNWKVFSIILLFPSQQSFHICQSFCRSCGSQSAPASPAAASPSAVAEPHAEVLWELHGAQHACRSSSHGSARKGPAATNGSISGIHHFELSKGALRFHCLELKTSLTSTITGNPRTVGAGQGKSGLRSRL